MGASIGSLPLRAGVSDVAGGVAEGVARGGSLPLMDFR